MVAAGLAGFGLLYCTQPLLPLIGAHFGVGPTAASLTVSASTGALALAVLPVSSLAEAIGRPRVMRTAMLAATALTLLCALAPAFWLLIGLRTAVGVALAGVVAVAMGHLGDEADPASLSSAMGVYVSGTTLGGVGGRLVAAGVGDAGSWRVAVGAVGLGAAVAVAAFLVLLPPTRRFTPSPPDARLLARQLREHLRDPGIVLLCLVAMLLMGGFVAAYNYLGYRLSAAPFRLRPALVGLVFLAYLAGTVSSTMAGRLADRYGRRPVLAASIVVMLAGVATTVPDRLACVLVGLVVLTAGFFGAHSVASGWSRSGPPELGRRPRPCICSRTTSAPACWGRWPAGRSVPAGGRPWPP